MANIPDQDTMPENDSPLPSPPTCGSPMAGGRKPMTPPEIIQERAASYPSIRKLPPLGPPDKNELPCSISGDLSAGPKETAKFEPDFLFAFHQN
jgi:hypothetical protein